LGEIMGRVLIVTGKAAEDIIRKAVAYSKTRHCINIVVTPIPIAAFLTTEYIANYLRNLGIKASDYDYILLPGLSRGSGKIVEETIGIKAVKGTINAYDLIDLLKIDDLSILSSDEPADSVLHNVLENSVRSILIDIEKSLDNSNSVSVGGVKVPINPPPIRVAAEVAEAHTLSIDKLVKEVSRLVESGADIISIGFEAYNPHPDIVKNVVWLLKKEFDVAIAIDTSIPSEIDVAIESGADMVINVDLTNIEKISKVDRSVAIVTTPREPVSGDVPNDVDERVLLLKKSIDAVKARGFEKVFADAILDIPIKTFRSMLAFHKFKSLYPEIPMFMGIGNVTELIDADSVGVNAILTMFAQEIGVSVLLTVEKSVKAKGSTLECKVASQMASIAKIKNSPPKDIGLSLLILKDKRLYEDIYKDGVDEVIYAFDEDKPYTLDPMGIFKIGIDRENDYIEALYIGRKGKILIKGRSAKAIRYEIASKELVSQISHALYLGQELAKAEIALKLGKNYLQDVPLFKKPQFIKF